MYQYYITYGRDGGLSRESYRTETEAQDAAQAWTKRHPKGGKARIMGAPLAVLPDGRVVFAGGSLILTPVVEIRAQEAR
jgi:hypothetical protein